MKVLSTIASIIAGVILMVIGLSVLYGVGAMSTNRLAAITLFGVGLLLLKVSDEC